MTVVLHISDTHFGTEQPAVVEALVQLAQLQRPDLVILSGDITQRAQHNEFAAARRFMDRLEVPASLVIPGNHDIPLFDLFSRLFMPYARYSRAFGKELAPEYESSDLLVVSVKTTRRYRHIEGEVSERQIEGVVKRLQQANPGQLRIVVTHQPVHVIKEEDRKNLLNGHDEAIVRWAEAGADLILGGHIHRPSVSALHEEIPGLKGRTWAVQAGTALSSRIRFEAGNSVNVIRCGIDQQRLCDIERWDYDPATRAFHLKTKEELLREA
ncbi:MAG: metallophosphoesterase family protein [Burkholderiaceae bacterium]